MNTVPLSDVSLKRNFVWLAHLRRGPETFVELAEHVGFRHQRVHRILNFDSEQRGPQGGKEEKAQQW